MNEGRGMATVTGILADPQMEVTYCVNPDQSVNQSLALLGIGVATKVNKKFGLCPGLDPLLFRARLCPSDVTGDDAVPDGMVALFTPGDSQGQLLLDHFASLESSTALRDGSQPTAVAKLEAAVEVLVQQVKAAGSRLEKAEAKAAGLETELKHHRQQLEVLEEQAESKADEFEAQCGALRSELRAERAERQHESRLLTELTVMVVPIRLRCLLDYARELTLEYLEFDSWEGLRGEKGIRDLAEAIFSRLSSFPRCPSKDAVSFLCAYNNVRRSGNVAAHTGSQEQLREAVATKPVDSRERRFLEELFRFTFKTDEV
jgi:hypothetical protein